ncbi:hypothetical protein DV515_00003962, partial [Chloebia gouldiae]
PAPALACPPQPCSPPFRADLLLSNPCFARTPQCCIRTPPHTRLHLASRLRSLLGWDGSALLTSLSVGLCIPSGTPVGSLEATPQRRLQHLDCVDNREAAKPQTVSQSSTSSTQEMMVHSHYRHHIAVVMVNLAPSLEAVFHHTSATVLGSSGHIHSICERLSQRVPGRLSLRPPSHGKHQGRSGAPAHEKDGTEGLLSLGISTCNQDLPNFKLEAVFVLWLVCQNDKRDYLWQTHDGPFHAAHGENRALPAFPSPTPAHEWLLLHELPGCFSSDLLQTGAVARMKARMMSLAGATALLLSPSDCLPFWLGLENIFAPKGVAINDDKNFTEKDEERKILNKVGRQLILLKCLQHHSLVYFETYETYERLAVYYCAIGQLFQSLDTDKKRSPHLIDFHQWINVYLEKLLAKSVQEDPPVARGYASNPSTRHVPAPVLTGHFAPSGSSTCLQPSPTTLLSTADSSAAQPSEPDSPKHEIYAGRGALCSASSFVTELKPTENNNDTGIMHPPSALSKLCSLADKTQAAFVCEKWQDGKSITSVASPVSFWLLFLLSSAFPNTLQLPLHHYADAIRPIKCSCDIYTREKSITPDNNFTKSIIKAWAKEKEQQHGKSPDSARQCLHTHSRLKMRTEPRTLPDTTKGCHVSRLKWHQERSLCCHTAEGHRRAMGTRTFYDGKISHLQLRHQHPTFSSSCLSFPCLSALGLERMCYYCLGRKALQQAQPLQGIQKMQVNHLGLKQLKLLSPSHTHTSRHPFFFLVLADLHLLAGTGIELLKRKKEIVPSCMSSAEIRIPSKSPFFSDSFLIKVKLSLESTKKVKSTAPSRARDASMSPGLVCHVKPSPEISMVNHSPSPAMFPPEDGILHITHLNSQMGRQPILNCTDKNISGETTSTWAHEALFYFINSIYSFLYSIPLTSKSKIQVAKTARNSSDRICQDNSLSLQFNLGTVLCRPTAGAVEPKASNKHSLIDSKLDAVAAAPVAPLVAAVGAGLEAVAALRDEAFAGLADKLQLRLLGSRVPQEDVVGLVQSQDPGLSSAVGEVVEGHGGNADQVESLAQHLALVLYGGRQLLSLALHFSPVQSCLKNNNFFGIQSLPSENAFKCLKINVTEALRLQSELSLRINHFPAALGQVLAPRQELLEGCLTRLPQESGTCAIKSPWIACPLMPLGPTWWPDHKMNICHQVIVEHHCISTNRGNDFIANWRQFAVATATAISFLRALLRPALDRLWKHQEEVYPCEKPDSLTS